jgi:hypothetical protein
LQRIAVDDEMIRLKNWVTVDPRKTGIRRFTYELSGTRPPGVVGRV